MSASTPALLTAFAAAATVACSDAEGDFDDFVTRVPDARPAVDAPFLTSIPDVTGRFFVSLATVVDVERPIYFIMDCTMNVNPDGSATVDIAGEPLDYVTLEVATGGTDLSFDNLPISMSGQFTLTASPVTIPGDANPFSASPMEADTVSFLFAIKTEDFMCGDAVGMVTSPLSIPLDGSTFGAIRVPDGAIGDQLPDPITDCGPDFTADAGVPDAAIPDATIPDATVPDATLPDASVSDATVTDAQVTDAPL